MAKLTLSDLTSLTNEASAVSTINNNNAATETALENTLSRDGTSPNTMGANIDMNSNRILNLPAPVADTEPARFIDVGNAPAAAAAALASQTAAAASATSAATSATTALNYLTSFTGTSTSSVAIGTGAKSFTTTTGRLWSTGLFLSIVSAANSANYMHGTVTSYDPATGALVMNILDIGGSGTKNDWNIQLSGTQGSIGPTGAVGTSGTPTVGQLAVWVTSTTAKGVSITGLVKGNGASDPTAAVSGTDYQAPIGTISGVAKGNGANALIAATAGTDFVKPDTATAFTKQQSFALATLTDAANISWDVSTSQKAKVTLGGNRTMNAVTNAVEGTTYLLWVIQDGTGTRTITWTTTGAGSFDFGAAGTPVLTTTINKADLLVFEAISIGGTLKLRFTGIQKGFT
jgi:hypothetical protein